MEATLEVVYLLNQELDLNLQISKDLIGLQSFDKNGITITPQVIENSKQVDGIILGPVDHNIYPSVADGGINPSGKLHRIRSVCKYKACQEL